MKLEVGERYVMRNGEVTGPLERCINMPEWLKDLRHTWKENGMWSASDVTGAYDIVAEYVEPQPQQPLRWVENCKPDRIGHWAYKFPDEVAWAYVDVYSEDQMQNAANGLHMVLSRPNPRNPAAEKEGGGEAVGKCELRRRHWCFALAV